MRRSLFPSMIAATLAVTPLAAQSDGFAIWDVLVEGSLCYTLPCGFGTASGTGAEGQPVVVRLINQTDNPAIQGPEAEKNRVLAAGFGDCVRVEGRIVGDTAIELRRVLGSCTAPD